MGKKHEFRPDKPRKGLLSRLYLTRRQRQNLLKWGLYTLLLLVLSVLQDSIFSRIHFFGATTELVPCGIFLICILEGTEGCSLFSLIAATVYLFSGTAPGTYCIVFITGIGICAAAFRQGYLQEGFGAAMLCTGGAMLLYELAVFIFGLFVSATHWGRIGVFCLTAVLTVAAAPLLYILARRIEAVGGHSWNE